MARTDILIGLLLLNMFGAYGMNVLPNIFPLQEIDKKILLHYANKVGLESVKKQLLKAQPSQRVESNGSLHYLTHSCVTFELCFMENTQMAKEWGEKFEQNQELTTIVFNTIKKLEEKNEYIEESITEETEYCYLTTCATNCLRNSEIRYCHRKIENSGLPYVEIKVNFDGDYRQELEKLFETIDK